MSQSKIELLEKALKRERFARKEAEKILEEKSLEIYQINQNLISVLNEKEIQLESLFKTIVDPYILMDLYGNVIKMNDAAVSFFGYNVEKESFNVTSTLYQDDLEYAMESYSELLEKGVFRNFRARVYNKKRELRWIEINSSLVFDNNNEARFAHGIVRDITEKLKAEQEREELLKHLTISNKELNDFAHVVSHDLKAPLRSMNALLTWLQEDIAELGEHEDIQQNLQMLIVKIDKMDHLISGILKYASVDKVERPNAEVDLDNVIHGITQTIHVPKHVTVEIPQKLPIVRGDKFRLHQLFQNLISNAIKYANPTEGKVTISCIDKNENWEFGVHDNGIGIEEKYHKKIFEVFQTLDDENSSTGVGLSIVKKIIALYGGDVWVTSTIGEGTTFHVSLPK